MHSIGIDIGGTFTDCIVASDTAVRIGKAASTPPDFEDGSIDSMRSAAERMGTTFEQLVADTDKIFHGCTIGTNALVEGRTAKIGVLTTRGHRDAIFAMGGGGRLRGMPGDYVSRVAHQEKSAPLVPKRLIEEIDERMTLDGDVLVALNEDEARAAIGRLLADGVEAIAISLLWSVVNPAHEQRLRDIVGEEAPGVFVSVGSEIASRTGEYERTVATVINAMIGPVMIAYLGALEQRLAALGYDRSVYVMTCSGGLIDADHARALPILTIGSGPVAGLIGSRVLAARDAGDPGRDEVNVITGDVGGTTFDVGVIRRGEPLSRATTKHRQYEYYVPTLDVRSIGAGGGSIIRYDENHLTLMVGPHSAGARPGPAAYQQGGTEPTVTDAALVLGYLNPDYFLGGAMSLSVEAAAEALARVGAPLGFDAEQTAAAAMRIVDSHMADAIRLASVQQGYDPRDHVFYAYGGAGPLHAAALCRELGMRRIVVPLSDLASSWSAFGVVSSDAVVIDEVPMVMSHPFDVERLKTAWARLEDNVAASMQEQGIERATVAFERSMALRYTPQINQVDVAVPAGAFETAAAEDVIERFEAEYARLFGEGTGYADAGFTMTSMRVRARAPLNNRDLLDEHPSGADGAPTRKGERGVIFYEDGVQRQSTPVYDGETFRRGMTVEGPAIVEFPDTTLVVWSDQQAAVDRYGSVEVVLAL